MINTYHGPESQCFLGVKYTLSEGAKFCHDILPLKISNSFFRNINLCKITCKYHLNNKTDSYNFSRFEMPVFVRRIFTP